MNEREKYCKKLHINAKVSVKLHLRKHITLKLNIKIWTNQILCCKKGYILFVCVRCSIIMIFKIRFYESLTRIVLLIFCLSRKIFRRELCTGLNNCKTERFETSVSVWKNEDFWYSLVSYSRYATEIRSHFRLLHFRCTTFRKGKPNIVRFISVHDE